MLYAFAQHKTQNTFLDIPGEKYLVIAKNFLSNVYEFVQENTVIACAHFFQLFQIYVDIFLLFLKMYKVTFYNTLCILLKPT